MTEAIIIKRSNSELDARHSLPRMKFMYDVLLILLAVFTVSFVSLRRVGTYVLLLTLNNTRRTTTHLCPDNCYAFSMLVTSMDCYPVFL